jgi:hypothetical protein
MSHPNDVGVSRHVDSPSCAYILQPELRDGASGRAEKRMRRTSSVSALTERAGASNDDVTLKAIKFNALGDGPRETDRRTDV